jgi:hypothetical protein
LDGALPNGFQKRFRGRSTSGTPTLGQGGRGGAEKNQLPLQLLQLPPPFAMLAPDDCRGAGRRPAVGREKEVTGGVPDTGGAAEEVAGDGDECRGRRRS